MSLFSNCKNLCKSQQESHLLSRRRAHYVFHFIVWLHLLSAVFNMSPYGWQERGIDGSIFQNRFKLHMTLGTMVLLDDAEITRAATLLQECQQDLVRFEYCSIKIVDCINKN